MSSHALVKAKRDCINIATCMYMVTLTFGVAPSNRLRLASLIIVLSYLDDPLSRVVESVLLVVL